MGGLVMQLKPLENFKERTMKNIRTVFATLTLGLVLAGSALAGETQTPPCAPGETQTPPCMAAPASVDSTTAGETQTPPASADILSLGELALDLLMY